MDIDLHLHFFHLFELLEQPLEVGETILHTDLLKVLLKRAPWTKSAASLSHLSPSSASSWEQGVPWKAEGTKLGLKALL